MKDYSIADLKRLTGYSERRIRQYIKSGHLPRPTLAGSRTRYSREALGRLSAIRTWCQEDDLGSPQVARQVRALTAEEVEDWAKRLDPEVPPPPSAAQPEPTSVLVAPAPTGEGAGARTPEARRDDWVRIPLIPGLDLMVRQGSGALVARLAEEIQSKYGATDEAVVRSSNPGP